MTRTPMGKATAGQTAGAPKSFEEMMERLEELVERLEGGNLSLEDSITSFEEGMTLVKSCSKVLQEAEQRIQKLTRDQEGKAPADGGSRSRKEEDDVEGELPF